MLIPRTKVPTRSQKVPAAVLSTFFLLLLLTTTYQIVYLFILDSAYEYAVPETGTMPLLTTSPPPPPPPSAPPVAPVTTDTFARNKMYPTDESRSSKKVSFNMCFHNGAKSRVHKSTSVLDLEQLKNSADTNVHLGINNNKVIKLNKIYLSGQTRVSQYRDINLSPCKIFPRARTNCFLIFFFS